jgi:AcrR family transcriptional regulator
MRAKNRTDGLSFLETARRKQIVQCAIEVLADDGYKRATLARIAEHAGVSKSVVVYHFGGKDGVFEHVISEVFGSATAEVKPRVEAESSAAGKLRAYFEARLEYLATHRRHMPALFELWMNFRTDDGRMRLGEPDATETVDAIERILVAGQRSGEFTAFSAPVMAMTIRQAVDGAMLRLRVEPGLDVAAYARELVALFDRATRKPA